MKKLIALLLAGIMLCCLAACTATNENSSVDSAVTDSGESPSGWPTGGVDGTRRGFMCKRDGEYVPVSMLFSNGFEDINTEICYGYLDETGEPVIIRGSFHIRNMLAGDDPVDCITVDPCDTPTESCRISSYSQLDYLVGVFFRPEVNENGEFLAALPIIPVGRSDVKSGFLMKNDDGSYSPIDYISVNERITTLVIAYGKIENGNVQLYDSKYWAKDDEEELNGFLTVIPTGTSVTECIVVVNTEKDANGNYLYCEPDNAPGVVQTSLAVIVNYST